MSKTIALVGAETLLGREMQDVLKESGLNAGLQLINATEASGSVAADFAQDPILMGALDEKAVAQCDVLLLSGTQPSSRKALRLAQAAPRTPRIVDITGALEEQPRARLRAPLAESGEPIPADAVHVVAHPAAIALSLVLRRLNDISPLSQSVVTVFEPASAHGSRGVDELQQQAIGLLTFQQLKKEVFDSQLAFNLLPRLGVESDIAIEDVEAAVYRHLTSLLGGAVPLPSLRLVQAPVFHAHSFSLFVRMERPIRPAVLAEGLEHPLLIDVRSGDTEPPSNVGTAGQGGITVGVIETDRTDPTGVWLWMVADNYRLAAENAALVVKELLA